MDISGLSEDLLNNLNKIAGRLSRNRVSDEALENTLKLLREETGFEDITLQGLKNILLNINFYNDRRDDVFNPKSGLISNFIIDGKNTDEIATSLNTEKNKTVLLSAIKGARKIDVSYSAVENKEEIIDSLESVKDERNEKLNKDVLNEEEKESIVKLIDRLKGVSDEEATERIEIPEFKSLSLLEKSLVNASVVSTDSRVKYYNYWKDIEGKFLGFDRALSAVDDSVRELFRSFSQAGMTEEVDPYADIENLTQTSYLPSYIIKVSPLKIKDESEDFMVLELFRDFFSMIGREIPQEYKPKKRTKADAEAEIATTARQDFDAEGGDSNVSIDPTAADDIQDEIDEAEKEIEERMVDKYTDPLFALMMRDKTIKGEYDDSVIGKAKELIKQELSYSELGEFKDDIEKIINDELDTFLDKFTKSMMVKVGEDEGFHIPLLDDKLAVKYFDRLEGTFKVNYFTKGLSRDKTFRKYSEAVQFINDGTEKFFQELGLFIKLKNSTKRVSPRPEARGRGGRDSTPVQYLGGIVSGLQPKSSQVDLDRMSQIENMLSLISEFYIKPLTGNMVLLEDVPRFYTSKYFKDFPSLLASSNVNMARRAISEGFDPIVETDDLETFINFLNRIKYHDSLVYTDDLNNLFSDSLDAYIKFFASVDSVVEGQEMQLDNIINRAKILFGSSLHDIAQATEDKTELDEIMFENQPLSFWDNKQKKENVNIETLITLLNSEEWQNFVKTTGRKTRGFKTLSERLQRKLLESDMKFTGPITYAMLEATDILRKMQGKKIYKSNLDISDLDDIEYVTNIIKEENNLDLYGIDIHNIMSSQSSFNDIADNFGLPTDIIYKVKGLFR